MWDTKPRSRQGDPVQVTIDGPAGVGKTSVGSRVAEKFSLLFIQSGSLYRAIAYADKNNLNLDSIEFAINDAYHTHLMIEGKKVNSDLDSEKIGELASRLARKGKVRDKVNEIITNVSKGEDVLVEGRDIGTVVLTHAGLKVFLTASSHERALRRHKQISAQGKVEDIEAELLKRDNRDKTRKIAPLKPAKDAKIIDTTSLTEDQVVEKISGLVTKHIG